MAKAALLALDWGMSNLRAYLLDADGNTLELRSAPLGIKVVKDANFRETLQTHCGDWLEQHTDIPIVAAGMVGSRQGWHDTPHLPTPANPATLGHSAVRVDELMGRPFAILSGVLHTPMGGAPDIMRGEAVQLLGALSVLGVSEGIFVLPGAHCKWIKVKDGSIDAFRTYMTGELYGLLQEYSILGKMFPVDTEITLPGFTQGLASAQFHHETLSHMLFSARTLGLFGQIIPADLPGYLSGILVGDEIASGLRWAGAGKITLIGSTQMTRLYRHALAGFGQTTEVAPVDVAAHGLHLLAQKIQW